MDFGKYLASKPALAVVTLIALQSTFFVVPLYTLTVDDNVEAMTVLDDWGHLVGHVTAPPYAPNYTAYPFATTVDTPSAGRSSPSSGPTLQRRRRALSCWRSVGGSAPEIPRCTGL